MKHRGRIQSQGNKIEESEDWSKENPLPIEDGKKKLSNLKSKHSRKELKIRSIAFDKLEKFMADAKKQGGVNHPISKTYLVPCSKKSERIDLEVIKGQAFV